MAYTLGNKCAKNLCKRIVLLQLIIENVVTCFFWNNYDLSELKQQFQRGRQDHQPVITMMICGYWTL